MASNSGEYCFSYSAKLLTDLTDWNGCYLLTRRLFDTAWCRECNDIILCCIVAEKQVEKSREEWRKWVTCFVFRQGIQFFFVIFTCSEAHYLFLAVCRLYDEFRRMHKCGWIGVDLVNVVFWCFCYKPWAVKLLILHINVFGCHCRLLGTCVWNVSCYFIYQYLCYVFSLFMIYDMQDVLFGYFVCSFYCRAKKPITITRLVTYIWKEREKKIFLFGDGMKY